MKKVKDIICIAFCCTPLIYYAYIWSSLPAIVPTHFDATGTPNGYSPKGFVWLINGFMAALAIGQYLGLNRMHLIDPKRSGKAPVPSFARLADGLVLFLTVLNLIILLAVGGHEVLMTRLVTPLVGLLFIFLGNVMYSLKPNYFAGIRVPWTLADDANWRATHRVAGVVWFVCGLLLVTGSFFLQQQRMPSLMIGLVLPMVLIPAGYSFWYFKRFAIKP